MVSSSEVMSVLHHHPLEYKYESEGPHANSVACDLSYHDASLLILGLVQRHIHAANRRDLVYQVTRCQRVIVRDCGVS